MKPATLRRWIAWHRWSSLVTTVNLLLLSVTGLILIFHSEIDALMGVGGSIKSKGPPLPMTELVANAEQSQPGQRAKFAYFDDKDSQRFYVGMAAPEESDSAKAVPVSLNAASGEVLARIEPNSTLTEIAYTLHRDLFAGLAGELFVGAMGLGVLIAVVSGIVVYVPFMRKLPFAALRPAKPARWLDWHNLAGAVTLGWITVVALTGVLLSLGSLVLKYYQANELVTLTAPYRDQVAPARIVPLDAALRAAEAGWPGHEMSFAVFPGVDIAGPHHYTFFMKRGEGFDSRVFKLAMVNAETGRLDVATEAPWYIKVILISEPLHFGDYAGWPLKLIWSAMTLLTIWICLTGLYLWRFKKRRPGDAIEARLAGQTERA
jgi:uncharacterized iron-regulated membrane protein